MACFASGTEVLFPGDVPGHQEQSGTKPDNTLRRRVFEPVVNQKRITSVDKYIVEREQKRLSGLDIPKHCRYFDSEGPLTYAGTRKVDGQMLTLQKRGNTILVLPIDQPTSRHLKRLAAGDAIIVIKDNDQNKRKEQMMISQ